MDKMDKEDILVRSRNDNRKGDEREVQNRTNAELFSYWIVIVILFVTALLSDAGVIGGEIFINGRSFLFKDFVWLLNFLSLSCEFGSEFYFSRKIWQLLLCLFFAAGVFSCLIF